MHIVSNRTHGAGKKEHATKRKSLKNRKRKCKVLCGLDGEREGWEARAGALPPISNPAASVENSRKPPQRLREDQKHKMRALLLHWSPGGSPTRRVPTSTWGSSGKQRCLHGMFSLGERLEMFPTPCLAVAVQSLSHVRLSVTPRTAAHQASLSFTISQGLLKLMSIDSVIPFSHLILCHPLLLLPSIFPNIKVFFNESALCIRWPQY